MTVWSIYLHTTHTVNVPGLYHTAFLTMPWLHSTKGKEKVGLTSEQNTFKTYGNQIKNLLLYI